MTGRATSYRPRDGAVRPVVYHPHWPWWRKAAYYARKPFVRQPEFDIWECE